MKAKTILLLLMACLVTSSHAQFSLTKGWKLKRIGVFFGEDQDRLNSMDYNDDKKINIELSLTQEVTGIRAFESRAELKYFDDPSLQLDLDASNFVIRRSTINYLDIVSEEGSRVYSYNCTIDSANVEVRNSQVQLDTELMKIMGNVEDEGFLSVNGVEEIALKKDRESRISIY